MVIRPLPQCLQQKAMTELNEDPNRIKDDIQHLREWAQKHAFLIIRTDDLWLLTFLRVSKFSLQKAKERLSLYYTTRSMLPEFSTNRNPHLPEIQEFLKHNIAVILPRTLDVLEPTRFLFVAKNADPEKVLLTTSVKVLSMTLDILAYEGDTYPINGIEAIYDFQNLPYSYLAQITPKFLKASVMLLQNAYPSRIKAIYCMNTPRFLCSLVNFTISLLSDKLKKRIHVYTSGNSYELHQSIPIAVLPEEYGGDAGPVSDMSNKLRLKVESYHKWFMEDSKYGLNESKCPGGMKNSSNELYGADGSFRTLNID